MSKKELTYSQALEELRGIVEKIESNDPDVDEMNTMIKRATELILFCKQKLTSTEVELAEAMKKLEE